MERSVYDAAVGFGGPRAAGGRIAPPVSAGPGGQPGLLPAAMSIRAGLNQQFAGL